MRKLGELASKYNVPIQSHVSENQNEIKWVHELHPECSSYTKVYDDYGLLNNNTILAHGCHLTDEELSLMQSKGGTAPISVFNIRLI